MEEELREWGAVFISLLSTGPGDLVLPPTQPCASNAQPESWERGLFCDGLEIRSIFIRGM